MLDPKSPDPKFVNEIASLLKKGGVIAYPTDTLYGLGGDAFNPEVIHRIRILKGRSGAKPFPYIIDKVQRLTEWGLRLSDIASAIADRFWPGPVSLVIRDSGILPSEMLDARRAICVRIPDNRIARSLAGALGGMLVATSANPAGAAAARNAQQAIDYFRGEIDAVVDGGPAPTTQPSTIVDVTTEKVVILREGAVPAQNLRAVISEFQ
ncbi:MAG: hypothetical protein Kow0099_23670 [Candidatus Abyssubacteria bacterium]